MPHINRAVYILRYPRHTSHPLSHFERPATNHLRHRSPTHTRSTHVCIHFAVFLSGFLAATSPPPPPPPAFGGASRRVRGTASCTATAVAADAASSAPAATGSPSAVSASVLSPREAVVELPPPDDNAAGESGYSVRWYEEDNPTVFDQVFAKSRTTTNSEKSSHLLLS